MGKEGEMRAIAAARSLGVGLDYLYSLLWSGKLRGRKDAEGRWWISVAAVEERRKVVRGRTRSHAGPTLRSPRAEGARGSL
jgi:hypothetical protein